MSQQTRGGLRRLLRGLQAATARGATVGDAFRAQPDLGAMESGIMAASDRSGRIDQGARHLEEHFGALLAARAQILRGLGYPIFLLHFAVVVGALPKLVLGGSMAEFIIRTVGVALILWGLLVIALLLSKILIRLAARNPSVDAALRAIPLIGKIRRSFAMSRFCATYEMHLDAGVNVIDSLASAAEASGSARVEVAVARMRAPLRAGGQVGPLLAASRAFPDSLSRAIRIAEDTGDLDKELARLAEEHREQGLRTIATLSEWFPKIVYLAIAGYVGYQIVSIYSGMMSGIEKAIQ